MNRARLSAFTVALSLFGASGACDPILVERGDDCTNDSVCKDDRICVAGKCVTPDATSVGDAVAPDSSADTTNDADTPDAERVGPDAATDGVSDVGGDAKDAFSQPDGLPSDIAADVGTDQASDLASDSGADTGTDAAGDSGPDLCAPDCTNAQCGSDGCGGSCGECVDGADCELGICVCSPNATTTCGLDGNSYFVDACGVTGGLAQDCGGNGCVTATGVCANCEPSCDGKQCGLDGCGGVCGSCQTDLGESCVAGQCICQAEASVACYEGNLHHFDACGGVGSLASACSWGCTSTTCDACAPQCAGKECGDDGCGGTCGQGCSGTDVCLASGQCLCVPQCSGKVCGDDGCGGTCGSGCTSPDVCNPAGQCECTPQCGGLECGIDPVCGTICGTCGTGETCAANLCIAAPTEDHVIFATSGAWDGNFEGGLALQDYHCQQAGTSGNATASLNLSWVALMSDAALGIDARSRVLWSGPVFNTGGESVEPNAAAWPWAPLSNPVRYDEHGTNLGTVKTHTGSLNDGTASGVDCSVGGRSWNSSGGNVTAGRVSSTAGVNGWLNGGGIDGCSVPRHLYCVNVRPEADHLIFATSTALPATDIGGLTEADQICQSAADSGSQTASLGRRWVALMSDSVKGIDARARVTWRGPVYNTGGELVESTPGAWPWAPLDNPVRYDEDGTDLGVVKTHTGTTDTGTASGKDCQGGGYAWNGSSPSVTAGRVSSTAGTNGWLNGGGFDVCSAVFHLYCVSQ